MRGRGDDKCSFAVYNIGLEGVFWVIPRFDQVTVV